MYVVDFSSVGHNDDDNDDSNMLYYIRTQSQNIGTEQERQYTIEHDDGHHAVNCVSKNCGHNLAERCNSIAMSGYCHDMSSISICIVYCKKNEVRITRFSYKISVVLTFSMVTSRRYLTVYLDEGLKLCGWFSNSRCYISKTVQDRDTKS